MEKLVMENKLTWRTHKKILRNKKQIYCQKLHFLYCEELLIIKIENH